MDTESGKYFRTPHTPWSLGATNDDKRVSSVSHLLGQEIVVTEKLDGQNSTLTVEDVFARSHDGPSRHGSCDWIKTAHARLRHLLDPGISVFVEDCYALHSIWYGGMAAERNYLHVFGVRDDRTGVHWSWDDVEMMATHLGLPTAPVLFRGVVHRASELERLMPGDGASPSTWVGVPIRMDGRTPHIAPGHTADSNVREGEVTRLTAAFTDPALSIVKSVRPGHVQSDEHWKDTWRPMHKWSPR